VINNFKQLTSLKININQAKHSLVEEVVTLPILLASHRVGLMVKNMCFLLGGHKFKSRGGRVCIPL
jgi:hypothetical protein